MTTDYAWFPSRRELHSEDPGVVRYAIGESWEHRAYTVLPRRSSGGFAVRPLVLKNTTAVLDHQRQLREEGKKRTPRYGEADMPVGRGMYKRIDMFWEGSRLYVVAVCTGPHCGGKRRKFICTDWVRPVTSCVKCSIKSAAVRAGKECA